MPTANRPRTLPLPQMLEYGLLKDGDLLRFLKVKRLSLADDLRQLRPLLNDKLTQTTSPCRTSSSCWLLGVPGPEVSRWRASPSCWASVLLRHTPAASFTGPVKTLSLRPDRACRCASCLEYLQATDRFALM